MFVLGQQIRDRTFQSEELRNKAFLTWLFESLRSNVDAYLVDISAVCAVAFEAKRARAAGVARGCVGTLDVGEAGVGVTSLVLRWWN